MEMNPDIKSSTDPGEKKSYICSECNAEYKYRTGLWRHKQKCKYPVKKVRRIRPTKLDSNVKGLREQLLKRNEDFKNKMELGREISKIIEEEAIDEEILSLLEQEALFIFRTV
jgi:hypothetical protein